MKTAAILFRSPRVFAPTVRANLTREIQIITQKFTPLSIWKPSKSCASFACGQRQQRCPVQESSRKKTIFYLRRPSDQLRAKQRWQRISHSLFLTVPDFLTYVVHIRTICLCTGWIEWMSHRKQRETKQQPSMLPGPAVPGCCLGSFRFLCNIHSSHSIRSIRNLAFSFSSLAPRCL